MKPILLFSALLAAAAITVGASAQGDPGFARCGAIADRDARLACYDSLQNRTAPPATTPGHYPEFNARPSVLTEPQNPAAPPAQAWLKGPMTATISDYAVAHDGHFRVTLDNGQIWEQQDSDGARAQFRSRGNRATISPGFWRSFDLRLNGSSAIFKVERVR
jgi:hypothetical protein